MHNPTCAKPHSRVFFTLNDSFPKNSTATTGRLHSMASGSFRDAKLERPVSGAELRRLLVASRPKAEIGRLGKRTFNVEAETRAAACLHESARLVRSQPCPHLSAGHNLAKAHQTPDATTEASTPRRKPMNRSFAISSFEGTPANLRKTSTSA